MKVECELCGETYIIEWGGTRCPRCDGNVYREEDRVNFGGGE